MHSRQWSKGSVEVPVIVGALDEKPNVNAVVPQLKKEYRPSILDMRKSSIARNDR
jgi:PII-like signaling protein